MPLHTDKLIQKEINKHNYMNNRTLLFVLTSSLKKYVFHNWLINNILYFCVT